MEPIRYFIKGHNFAVADPGLQDALARVHGSPERPRCLCVSGGVEMYVARHADYVVKRMPDTGHQHHPTCPSFEPEPGMSGLGELAGVAIIEHAPDQVEVRTDFAMSRMPGKAVQRGEAVADPAEAHAPCKRMSLRALLHFLYERAGLNRWYPAMEGRRNQGVLHKYLCEAARGVMVKGTSPDERLYVPEPFRAELKDEIGARRRKKLALLLSAEDAVQFKMAIIVGEYNGSEPTAFGRRIVVKHMPDAPLYIENKAWERVERSYAAVLQAREADVSRKPRVMIAALVYAKREHVYQVDRVSLMLTTDQWIPPGRVVRVASDRSAPGGAAVLHEAAAIRRQVSGSLPQRPASGLPRWSGPTSCRECSRGCQREGGEGEGTGQRPAALDLEHRYRGAVVARVQPKSPADGSSAIS